MSVISALVPCAALAQPVSELAARGFPQWGQRTVVDVMDFYGEKAVRRMQPFFALAGVDYPPTEVVLLATKRERTLEVWARDRAAGRSDFRHIRTYRIRGLSGEPGPKLFEGDRQVPEGIYDVSAFNPNSNFHLSLKLNYPNHFDRYHARADGRSRPGSNIFIHGKTKSKGCLAMGDPAIEELFVLTRHTGASRVTVVIAPHDPRREPLQPHPLLPEWTSDLYEAITLEFTRFPVPATHAAPGARHVPSAPARTGAESRARTIPAGG